MNYCSSLSESQGIPKIIGKVLHVRRKQSPQLLTVHRRVKKGPTIAKQKQKINKVLEFNQDSPPQNINILQSTPVKARHEGRCTQKTIYAQ